MRLIFAGTPVFAVPSLRALIDSGRDIVAVFCQPDRPAGRGRKLRVCPVKQLALAHELRVYQPRSLRPGESQDTLRALDPDLMVVAAYGLILPQAALDIPRLGCVNVHASLLPRWRGAAPIVRAIEAGDRETGICLMQMDAGLDTGPVLACGRTTIASDDTGGTLHDRLAAMGGELLVENLPRLLSGAIHARPQGETGVTYATKLSKDQAAIDWHLGAGVIERRVRAFNPWPMAHTWHRGVRLRVLEAQLAAVDANAPPGTVQQVDQHGVVVACGERGALCLKRLQRDGGRPMTSAEFIRGHDIQVGEQLGSATAG